MRPNGWVSRSARQQSRPRASARPAPEARACSGSADEDRREAERAQGGEAKAKSSATVTSTIIQEENYSKPRHYRPPDRTGGAPSVKNHRSGRSMMLTERSRWNRYKNPAHRRG